MEYRSSAVAPMFLLTSTDPCLPTDWEDPMGEPNIEAAFTLYSPMCLIMEHEAGKGGSPDDLYFVYDQFFRWGTDVYKSEVGGIGAWHAVAATYDADGGICPPDGDANLCPPGTVTGLVTVYMDGIKGSDPVAIDPNIPQDPNYDIVRIGDTSNALVADDWGAQTLIGDFNHILIYDTALTEGEVYYASGIMNPTYVANTSLANVVPKSPPGGPYDANNIDIVNFIDFDLLGKHWLEAPLLWP
jgi:hypothetical protein